MIDEEVVSEEELKDVGGMEIIMDEEAIIDIAEIDEDQPLEKDLLDKKKYFDGDEEEVEEDPLLESYMFHGHEEEMY
jgi:hypothetical protein